MSREDWTRQASLQEGLLTRAQLAACGVDRWAVRHRVSRQQWVQHTPTVIGTTTGELSRTQVMWLGVLHGGPGALVGELTAAEVAGLRNWHRDAVTIVVPQAADVGAGYPGIVFRRTRRHLAGWQRPSSALPTSRLEPAVLTFASAQTSPRTAEGILAATVQQRLSSPQALLEWIDRLRPLRGADRLRRALREIEGGAHSTAEIDVRRMCRAFGLAPPARQVRRRDATGRTRYTDCEWISADGRTVVLEVDGAFHFDVGHWEDDLARQRALTSPHRIVVRCTAREIRDRPERVAADLRLLGVPAA